MLTNNKPSILIIDDEEGITDILAEEFEDEGFIVECVHNGREGIELFKSKKFDAVVSDNQMPAMTGLEMFIEIRKINQHIPLYIFTGCNVIKLTEEFQKLKNIIIGEKPFISIDIVNSIKKAIENNISP